MSASPGMFRAAAGLRTERYEPAHPAPDAPPDLRGAGALTGTWIACEEPGAAEGWLRSGIELVMDSTLEPGAVIGRHVHRDTEELYLVLGGRLTVRHRQGERRRRCANSTSATSTGCAPAAGIRPGQAKRAPGSS